MRTPLLALAAAMIATPVLSAQRTIEILGAPLINKSFKLRLISPAASKNNKFILALSVHTDQVTKFPPAANIQGDLLLPPTFFIPLLFGKLTGTDTIPSNQSHRLTEQIGVVESGSGIEAAEIKAPDRSLSVNLTDRRANGKRIARQVRKLALAGIANVDRAADKDPWDRLDIHTGDERRIGETRL